MTLALLAALTLLLTFQFAVLFGPPFVPTLKKERKQALDLLDLKKGQTLYDLGCGDGTLLREAAQRGLKVVGYEINPALALVAWLKTRRYRKNIKIKVGNFWRADLGNADGVFAFMASRYMKKLDLLIDKRTGKKPLKLVSYGFAVPGRKEVVRKGPMILYRYS